MFSFISKFFEDRDVNTTSPMPIAAPIADGSAGVKYDPGLIDELKNDHVRLVEIYNRIWQQGYAKDDYKKLSLLLSEFKSEFQSHILKENVRFYVYLEQNIKADPHSHSVIREFRVDMNEIANAVLRFCKKYHVPTFSLDLKASFESDYETVGQVLTRRVTLEERDLYSLYHQ